MKILVTGGAGFIASNFINNFLTNHQVFILDDLSSGKLSNLNNLQNVVFIKHHIDNNSNLELYFKDIDFVFHFAASVGVHITMTNPIEVFLNNIISSEKVLQTCYNLDIPLIIASSSEIYGKQEISPLNEEFISILPKPQNSRWLYSLSKISDEFIAHSYKYKGLKVLICRFFNMIGSNQSSEFGMVVPKFIQLALSNCNIPIYGDGMQSRSFCDVLDGCNAINILFTKFDELTHLPDISYNIGNPNPININDLATKIVSLTNSESKFEYLNPNDFYSGFDEIYLRVPDISKMISLGWQPKNNIDNTLLNIINDYRKAII